MSCIEIKIDVDGEINRNVNFIDSCDKFNHKEEFISEMHYLYITKDSDDWRVIFNLIEENEKYNVSFKLSFNQLKNVVEAISCMERDKLKPSE